MNREFEVGVVTTIYRPSLGGPATYLENLLGRMEEAGIDTLALVPERSSVAPSNHVRFAFYRRRYRVKYLDLLISELCLLRALRGALGRVRVLYCHGADVALGMLSLTGRRKHRPRMVQKFTGYSPWENMIRLRGDMGVTPEEFCALSFGALWRRYGLLLAGFDWLHRRSLSLMDMVIVPGCYLGEMARRLGVREDRIKVVYNTAVGLHADPGEEIPQPAGAVRTMIIACRLVAHKGLGELVDWVGSKDGWRLWIAGEGPERRSLVEQIREKGFANVSLLGALAPRELRRRVRSAQVFVLNSLYEGFPHVLLESVAAGRPYAASRIPGNEEVHRLLGEDGGTLFDPHSPADFWLRVEQALRLPPQRLARARETLQTTLDESTQLRSVFEALEIDPDRLVRDAPHSRRT